MYLFFSPSFSVIFSMKWKSIAKRRRSPSEALAVQKRSLLFTRRSFLVSKPYIIETIMYNLWETLACTIHN